MDFTTAIITAGGVAGALTAILTLTKRGRGWVVSWGEGRKSRKGMPDLLERIHQRQLLFEAELMPNGGDSMKDGISRIDKAVQFSGARWRAIIDRDEVATYECDLQGHCTQSNRSLCNLFGLDREEMLGEGWMRGLMPDDRERVYDIWMSSVKKGIPYECNYMVRHADTGAEIEVTAVAEPMINDRGHIIGFHGSITSAKPMEVG